MTDLANKVHHASETDAPFCLIKDKLKDKAAQYFSYQNSAIVLDIQNAHKRLKYDLETREVFIERIRHGLVHAMGGGKQLVLNLGTELCDFHEFDSEQFPITKLLHVDEILKPDICLKYF